MKLKKIMKTNFLFFSLLIILISGCSKDDDSNEQTGITANEKFFNECKSSDGSNTIFSIKYNSNKKVEKIDFGQDGLYVFTYEGEKVISLDAFLQNNESFTFSYDVNEKINSFTKNGETTSVIYDSEKKFYYYENANGDEHSIYINDEGDVRKFLYYDISENDLETSTILYESGNYKGILTNTNNPMIAMHIALPERNLYYLVFGLTKIPLKTIVTDNVSEFENTFDDQGFLTSSTHDTGGDGLMTINFNYIKL